MSKEIRGQADARLDAAAHNSSFADPRPPLRDRLRDLKEAHPAAFDQARAHFEQQVVPALAQDDDPLATWVEYARFLGALTAPGRLLAVDADGAARPYTTPTPGTLVLYVPDDTAVGVLPALLPAEPSAAQQATIALLVERKLALQAADSQQRLE